MTNRTLTLRLEPSADGEPIAGWLCDERGNEHCFVGWLGLLTLLEQARVTSAAEARRHAPDVVDMGAHASTPEDA